MKPVNVVDDKKAGKVTIRAECRADEGKKHVEKVEMKTHDVDTVKYVERKLVEKGVQRLERHPADGLPLKHDPKKGHGGKYTWEGPDREVENELEPAPPAIDDKDPNYVDEAEEETLAGGGDQAADEEEASAAAGSVVGEVEVPKAAEEGVARVEVDPRLTVN